MLGGAIVSSTPGTTRDRRECVGNIGGTTFRLVDTAGIDGHRLQAHDAVTSQMMEQSWQAAKAADLVLLVLDARVGMTSDWMETARWLRKASTPRQKIVVLANKLEGDSWDYDGSPILDNLTEVSRVGFGPAIIMSAIHGEGLADVAAVIEEMEEEKRLSLGLPEIDDDQELGIIPDEDKPLQLAILGRQNVGKVSRHRASDSSQYSIAGATNALTSVCPLPPNRAPFSMLCCSRIVSFAAQSLV
jgi:GTP-binding protein